MKKPMKQKTTQAIKFINELHEHITNDPQFRKKDILNKSEKAIQAEIRPLIIEYLTKYFKGKKNANPKAKAHKSFYWEGQEGDSGYDLEKVFGSRNYPDFSILAPYAIAIEYKQGESGSLMKQAIGQAMMHTLSGEDSFDFSYILFHDGSKDKRIAKSKDNDIEKEIIEEMEQKFNVFIRIV